jgi:type I restriction enzyme M protein
LGEKFTLKSQYLLRKFWGLCHTLRDEGVASSEYVEQLTYLLFLKMVDQRGVAEEPLWRALPLAASWSDLKTARGPDLIQRYRDALRLLGSMPGTMGAIYLDARNRIDNPDKLAKLIKAIDAEDWLLLDLDVKGDLYEGLLQKCAEDIKSGAGQYFTPRPLIRAIVACVDPQPMKTIADPACGTGGFLLGAHAHLSAQDLSAEEVDFLRTRTFSGNEIVPGTHRLCLMNLYLHGIGRPDEIPTVNRRDALTRLPRKVDYVFANPPFGRRSETTSDRSARDVGAADPYDHLPYTTSNKQLNFLQHIARMLRADGKAAVVVPDNVLFERGVGDRVRRMLLEDFDLHTVLRLPTGIFYAQGVKANVLFFDASRSRGKIKKKGTTWFYDLRTDIRLTLKNNALKDHHLSDFVSCFKIGNKNARQESVRFKCFQRDEIIERPGANLDLRWNVVSAGSEAAAPPLSLTQLQSEIIDHLEKALSLFKHVPKN